MGAFGYFPTYTLGNLYSAQLLAAARADLEGDETLEDMWRRGEFAPYWIDENKCPRPWKHPHSSRID